jgi:hypothetical protein
MYIIKLNGQTIYEPYMDTAITDASLSSAVNSSDTFKFTVSGDCPQLETAEPHADTIELWRDGSKLFEGYISDKSDDLYGSYTITCISALGYLADTLVRPYSTLEGEQPLTAPSSVDGYFQWLVDQHNEHALDSRKTFSVGVNQGSMLDTNNYIYRSATGLPKTSEEIKDKILDNLGGYLFLRYDGNEKILDLYADVHEANAQIIDFGENLTGFEREIDGEDMYTAIRPVGSGQESEGGSIDISVLPNAKVTDYAGFVKLGDVVYSPAYVSAYGYREKALSVDSVDPNYLLKSACVELNKCLSPSREINIKAVDLSMFTDGVEPLKAGQVARVRVDGRGVDEYLLVSKIELDLGNPAEDAYTLGDAFESLTGRQSGYVQALNASINKNVDAVAALDSSLKETAQIATEAGATADAANTTANNAAAAVEGAVSAAEEAKDAADNAAAAASSAITAAGNAQSAADEAKKVATNYMSFTNSGLVVGDMTAGNLGGNVLIDADSVDIRDGQTVLSTFAAKTLQLGDWAKIYATADDKNLKSAINIRNKPDGESYTSQINLECGYAGYLASGVGVFATADPQSTSDAPHGSVALGLGGDTYASFKSDANGNGTLMLSDGNADGSITFSDLLGVGGMSLPLAISSGGTGATTAADALTALGAASATDLENKNSLRTQDRKNAISYNWVWPFLDVIVDVTKVATIGTSSKTSFYNNNSWYQKSCGVVCLHLDYVPASTSWTTLGTLPSGYRPVGTVTGALAYRSSGNLCGMLSVDSDGVVKTYGSTTASYWVGSISFASA